jgi:D-amino peptidase
MKVLMMTDLEGVAGVVSFEEQTYPTAKHYEAAKKLLTAEVNAAAEGMIATGVEDILVIDAHGPGGIVFEDLHPAARLEHGRPLGPREKRHAVYRDYDVAMMIGQHAMAGATEANLNHTQNSRAVDAYALNGKPIGEIAQFALCMGGLGLPVIFLSGDDAACREARALIPGITTAAVKQGMGRNSAISLSKEESRRRIQEGVRKALQHHRAKPLRPLAWKGPFVLEKRFFHTDQADLAAAAPDAERVDNQTVRFRSRDIVKIAYR